MDSQKHTLMSMKPGRSSIALNGFAAPPSFSIFPAHALHEMGFSDGEPSTRPAQASETATMVSSWMSSGRDGRDWWWALLAAAAAENSCAE